jgi:hypothetical protein
MAAVADVSACSQAPRFQATWLLLDWLYNSKIRNAVCIVQQVSDMNARTDLHETVCIVCSKVMQLNIQMVDRYMWQIISHSVAVRSHMLVQEMVASEYWVQTGRWSYDASAIEHIKCVTSYEAWKEEDKQIGNTGGGTLFWHLLLFTSPWVA